MSDNHKKILIADDEEDISWAISRCLHKVNPDIAVTCVDSGDKAFEYIQDERFDLVVSDLRMPGRTGLELIPEIRNRHPETKIILMTAYGSQEVMDKSDALGSFFYLEKPFDIGYLKQLILEALELKDEGFNGAIDRDGIRELVELSCSNMSSSSLMISRMEERGAIYFQNGDIIHAECGNLEGERAFFNILNWSKGTFRINRDVFSVQRTILRDWRSLLHQCA